MDRNREARRGSMGAVNGLSRRRQQRSSNLRDSPEEDGAMEMQESSRIRDRGVKKDRDRDRDRSSSRTKRRRGERLMHGSNREEGDDTSQESVEENDDDEEDDASVSVRLPPPANSSQILSSSSSIQQQQNQNHHHDVRKSSFPTTKSVRPPMPSWKVTEEMIGVSIPRKARSSSVKRSQDCWVFADGSWKLIRGQTSASSARPSPPSSSNVSVRKKKLINGNKQRPPKIAKTSAFPIQEDIEIEVAEVLFGMTRQAPPSSNKQDNNKEDTKDANGLSKSRVSSPNSISQTPATLLSSVLPAPTSPMVSTSTAPKRERLWPRLDEGSPTSPVSSVAPPMKTEPEMPPKTEEASSPRWERNPSVSPSVDNGGGSIGPSGHVDSAGDLAKPEIDNQIDGDKGNLKEETAILPPHETPSAMSLNFEKCIGAAAASKGAQANGSPRKEKFSIDLMAPPLPEKLFDRDGISDLGPEKKTLPGSGIANGNLDKVEKASKHEGTSDQRTAVNVLSEDFNLKKQAMKEKSPDLQLELEKHDIEGLSLSYGSKQQQQQAPKQQHKSTKIDSKQERPAPSASLPLPVPIAGWPGGFPPFGYMGQVPSLQAVVPVDADAKAVQQPPHFLQPQVRPKRCATHSYIAQNICYHHQMARLNPFYAAAAMAASAAAPLYGGAKQYNLNAVPPSEAAAILGNPLQGAFPPRSSAPAIAMAAFPGPPPPNDKSLAAAAAAAAAANGNTYMDPAAQRKQFMLSQSSQTGGGSMAPPNMTHGHAFVFPIGTQQPAMANRSGASTKSTPGIGNAAAVPSAVSPSSAAAGSGAAGHTASTMSFNYAGLTPIDAQYMAILQNNAAYPFPIASAHIGGSTPFRGASPAQSMPLFNGSFYSSQMANPQQQQQFFQMHQEQMKQLKQLQQQQQEQIRQQTAHQNQSTSSGSSSSQKHSQQSHQQQRAPTSAGAPAVGSNSHGFPASKPQLHLLSRPDTETGCDSPSTADSSNRVVSQAQKGTFYGQNFSMPIHSQNFALISPAAAALAGSGGGGSAAAGGGLSENKQQHQAMKVDLTPSQAYAMSFASFGGSAASAASASGLDFAAIVQNPTLLQNLSEAARHGYHQIPAAAVAAVTTATQAAQYNKDGKSLGGSAAVANANAATDDAKIAAASGGSKSVGQQHSLNFSRPDDGSTSTNIIGNLTDASTRALNLLHPPANGARTLNPTSSAPPSSAATNSPSSQHLPSSQSKQQYNLQTIQFQQQHQRIMMMQQQQQMQMQQQMMSRNAKSSATTRTGTNNNISTKAMAATAVRLPQGGVGAGEFSPSITPAGGSTGASNSPQWKPSSSGRTITAAPASSANSSSSSARNQMLQQQPPFLTPSAHHTQISFGASNKPLSSTTLDAGSPQSSLLKTGAAATAGGGNGGSPRASSSLKSGQPPSPVLLTPLQQHQAVAAAAVATASKNSPSAASSLKPSTSITNSSSNNRNNSSILGHPNVTPSSNSITKKLQQQQQQHPQSLPKQPFQQPPQQPFFNNSYIQAQTSQSNQLRRQSEEHQQQHQNSTSGMLSLSASSDPAKSAGSSLKRGLTTTQAQSGILHQHTAQFATMSMPPHPFISAAFPYMHSMQSPSASVKPASAAATDQKQLAAGNENVHACWKQPEKR